MGFHYTAAQLTASGCAACALQCQQSACKKIYRQCWFCACQWCVKMAPVKVSDSWCSLTDTAAQLSLMVAVNLFVLCQHHLTEFSVGKLQSVTCCF